METVEIEPESDGKDVNFEQITALVKAKYPKIAPLLLIFKKQIKEATKGMEVDEILGYVKQFTENKGSQKTSDPNSAEYNANWA